MRDADARSPSCGMRSSPLRGGLDDRPRADDGRAPRRPPRALRGRARASATSSSRASSSTRRSSRTRRDLAAYPARSRRATSARPRRPASTSLFAPPLEEFYPAGLRDLGRAGGRGGRARGRARPGHFRGVATACLKLFTIVRPDVAYFGRKDAQQVAVVKQLVRDLNLELEIRVVPTVRDADGLALSSRNVRLSRRGARAARSRSRARSRPATPTRRAAILAEAGHRARLRRRRRPRRPDPRRRRPRRLDPPDRQRPPGRRHR